MAHVLALAPIDVWVRMLARMGGVKPRYWVRFGCILITSAAGTVSTVHERVILSIVRRVKFGRDPRVEHESGAVVILGYYRSGTTHFHNVMSCDDRFVTPKWFQCLAGQGFWFGWSVIRFVLVAFLGSSRPQDAVGFGPRWPGEDDFALCSWGGCSSIPGRFVKPSTWDDWKRWHGLDGLSEKELNRWRSLSAMFVWKLTRGRRSRSRVVLLKTPSHTARVAELDRLFKGNVKFVHLVRDPRSVIDSNVRLHDSLKDHLLEDAPDVQTVRDRIVEEYAYSETKCCDELEAIDPDRWVRVRFSDLRADEMGTMRDVYASLGIEWNDEQEQRMLEYLGGVGAYSSSKTEIELGEIHDEETQISTAMIERYGLDQDARERVVVHPSVKPKIRIARGMGAGLLVALGLGCLWVLSVLLIHMADESIKMRLIPLVWICGGLIGTSVRAASLRGSMRTGMYAALLTLAVVVGVAFPVTVINYNWADGDGTNAWLYHNAKGGIEGLKSVSSLVYVVLGMVTAYRLANNDGPSVPGNGV